MNKNIELLKELYELKHKLNTIINKVHENMHENMHENNKELLINYNSTSSSDSGPEQQKDWDNIF